MYPERTGPTLDPTGDPRVDEAIAGLCALGETDLDERPVVLEAVHDRLREILGQRGDASPGEPGRGERGAGDRR